MTIYVKANPKHDLTIRPTPRGIPAVRPERTTLRIPLAELVAKTLDDEASKEEDP